jgi:hypothetical protein
MSDNAKTVSAAPDKQSGLREPPLPELRFSLRHLFWFVTLVCVVLAAVAANAGSGFASAAILLAVLVVGLHVAGTAIGLQLREHADRRQACEAGQTGDEYPKPLPTLRRSPLHERGIAMPWLRVWIATGFAGGGALGAAILAATIGHRTTLPGVFVGAVSAAILGGWFAFIAGSFWAILRQGWRDAVKDPHHDAADPTPQP